jgi:hypothetical protein
MSQDYPGPPQKSGGGTTVVVIVLVVLGVIGLLCVGVCGLGAIGLRWGAQEASKQLPKVGAAMQDLAGQMVMHMQATIQIQTNREVTEKLGTPVEIEPIDAGNFDSQAATTKISYKVKGPKGSAQATGEGTKQGNEWKITKLQVQFADGSVIDVDTSQAFPPNGDHGIPFETSNPIPIQLPPESTPAP